MILPFTSNFFANIKFHSKKGHLIDNINKANWTAVRYPFKHDPCYKKVVKLLEGLWPADKENTTVLLIKN